jgi:hypothetical protein
MKSRSFMTDDLIDVNRRVDERGAENDHAEPQVTAGDGLAQDNPSRPTEHQEKVRLGQEAMARQRRGWDDWMAIGEALAVGRAEVMRKVGTNEPIGRRYEKAMAEWLVANSFKEIDKGTRSRLLDCLEHRTEIEAWRSVRTGSERFRFNHPNTVFRKWKAATTVPDANAKPRTSPVAKLKESIALLSEENESLRRKIERDGGDLTSMAEGPNDIATADGKPSTPTQPEEDDPKRSKDFDAAISLPPDMPGDDYRRFNTNLIRLCQRYGVRINWASQSDHRGQA